MIVLYLAVSCQLRLVPLLESIFGGRWLNYPVERQLSSVQCEQNTSTFNTGDVPVVSKVTLATALHYGGEIETAVLVSINCRSSCTLIAEPISKKIQLPMFVVNLLRLYQGFLLMIWQLLWCVGLGETNWDFQS